ncbi:MAG: aldo/keto reductase [Geminicoccus sp.]|nr:aldo/keto reductase [Geminicoccus sp.]MDB2403430.1 aldo/keto reductase [bacterium]
MKMKRLGRTDMMVSELCLGTMTWGQQNTLEEGHAQMDWAQANGVNFFDVAEMYPSAPTADTCGRTEEIIGEWFTRSGKRADTILATKVAGPDDKLTWIREGKSIFDAKNIRVAIEGSLRRLQTDYIDLYQLHWPDRGWTHFRKYGQTKPNPDRGADRAETLETLDALVQEGKIRAWGVSNDSPWGTMDWVRRCENTGKTRLASIQNPYSLLNRVFDGGNAEISMNEDVSLLAYSPLAAGHLSGKYLRGQRPEGSRLALWPKRSGYTGENGVAATEKYVALAQKHGLDPSIMAHAFVYMQPFMTSSIVGGTSIPQLEVALEATTVTLSDEVLAEIDVLHRLHTYPCP